MATDAPPEMTLENDLASFTIAIVLVRLAETELEAGKQYSREQIARAVNNLDIVKSVDYFVKSMPLGCAIVIFQRYFTNISVTETLREIIVQTLMFVAFLFSTCGTTICFR